MSKEAAGAPADWRAARRRSARDSIVDAAWQLVGEEGLAALSLRDLAKRAGTTTPTIYAYFDSKQAIYDAMFERAATEFAERMAEPYHSGDPSAVLTEGVRRFADFCTSDVARYQLLFQRTIPGFEPTPDAFAPAVRALEGVHERLALSGVTDPGQVDMWTALSTGLVDQQISNDPGGERWVRLIDDFVTMFLAYCHSQRTPAKRSKQRNTTKGART
jgi:AcrR family transcriptional regulator